MRGARTRRGAVVAALALVLGVAGVLLGATAAQADRVCDNEGGPPGDVWTDVGGVLYAGIDPDPANQRVYVCQQTAATPFSYGSVDADSEASTSWVSAAAYVGWCGFPLAGCTDPPLDHTGVHVRRPVVDPNTPIDIEPRSGVDVLVLPGTCAYVDGAPTCVPTGEHSVSAHVNTRDLPRHSYDTPPANCTGVAGFCPSAYVVAGEDPYNTATVIVDGQYVYNDDIGTNRCLVQVNSDCTGSE